MKRASPWDFDHHSNKKHCETLQNASSQDGKIEGVLHHVIQWLLELTTSHRPRTREKLCNALRPICSHTYSVDSYTVFVHLQLNNYIRLEEVGPTKLVHVQHTGTADGLQIFVPTLDPDHSTGINERISDDFSTTLKKVCNWLKTNIGLQNRPIPYESFMPCLHQMCQMRKMVDPGPILDHLAHHGFISQDLITGELEYRLPKQLRHAHYMSSPNFEEHNQTPNVY